MTRTSYGLSRLDFMSLDTCCAREGIPAGPGISTPCVGEKGYAPPTGTLGSVLYDLNVTEGGCSHIAASLPPDAVEEKDAAMVDAVPANMSAATASLDPSRPRVDPPNESLC